jgi:hypothetical protein
MSKEQLSDYETQKRQSSGELIDHSRAGVGFFTNRNDSRGRHDEYVEGLREGERAAARHK